MILCDVTQAKSLAKPKKRFNSTVAPTKFTKRKKRRAETPGLKSYIRKAERPLIIKSYPTLLYPQNLVLMIFSNFEIN